MIIKVKRRTGLNIGKITIGQRLLTILPQHLEFSAIIGKRFDSDKFPLVALRQAIYVVPDTKGIRVGQRRHIHQLRQVTQLSRVRLLKQTVVTNLEK